MIQLVTHDSYGEFVDDLAEMHRLRYRVFKERLGWDVQVSGGMEIDEFDTLHPAYLLRQPLQKRLAWRDFLEIKKGLAQTARE